MPRHLILLKSFVISAFLLFALAMSPKEASASIGLVELRSTTNEDYRCFVASLIQVNNWYDVAVNCVNLIFPANPPKVSYYILWSTPLNGKGPQRIGDLGKGIVRFDVAEPFSSLFVTLEVDPNVRAPSKSIVMNGGVESIKFLQRPTTPTPSPEVTQGEETNKPVDTSQLSTREKLLLALKRAGVAAVIALVAIVGLIFVVTRSRG